jgi:preprotein translocase subunit SecY
VRLSRREILLRVLVTALCLTAWRALTFVPLPGTNLGGTTPTEGVSPVALGLGPYVDAFVVIIMLRLASSTFNSIIREGSIARYRRWEVLITAAVAVVGANNYTRELQAVTPSLLPVHIDGATWLGCVLTLTAGTLVLYGLGQVINFQGIAVVGRSTGPMLIYAIDILIRRAGDLSSAVAHRTPDFSLSGDVRYLLVPVLAILIAVLAVAMDRARRRIPIQFGRSTLRGGAEHSSIPLGLLASGIVVPVVVADVLVYAPAAAADFLASSPMPAVRAAAAAVHAYWRPDGSLVAVDALYLAVNAGLIVFLAVHVAWFWIGPHSVASELRGHGATIRGVRPDAPTGAYLGRVLTRLSFIGGVYPALAVVVAPVLAGWITGIPRSEASFDGFAVVLTAAICLTIMRGLEESGERRRAP